MIINKLDRERGMPEDYESDIDEKSDEYDRQCDDLYDEVKFQGGNHYANTIT